MQKPITSRIKRAPGAKRSMAKQTETGDPKLTAGGKGEPTEVITKKKVDVESKKNYPKSEQACDPGYIAKHGSAACERHNKLTPEQRKKGETKTETKEVEVKETKEGKDWEGKYKTATKGKVKQPWEIRRLGRSTTILARQIGKAERRLDKYGVRDADGNYTMKTNLSSKQERKFRKHQLKYSDARKQSANQSKAVDSGRNAGEDFHSGQRDRDQGEGTDAQQKSTMQRDYKKKEDAKAAAEIARTNKLNNAAQESGVVNSGRSADKAIKVPSNQNFLGEVSTDLPSDALTYKSGDYSTSFGTKGKSAVAKKMAGNRSNKSGSAFKMKGYGKR